MLFSTHTRFFCFFFSVLFAGVTAQLLPATAGGSINDLEKRACAPNQYLFLGFICVDCSAGDSCDGTTQVQCAAGTYAAAGAGVCSACTGTQYCPSGSAAPKACPAGYTCANGVGSECPAGTSSAQGTNVCSPCTGIQYCPAGSGTPQTCPAGDSCTNGIATACSAGSYAAAGDGACSTCPRGAYCLQGATAPHYCSAGSANGLTGQSTASACVSCTPGTFASATGSFGCCKCCDGYYQGSSGRASCTRCTGSHHLTGGPGATAASQCGTTGTSAGTCTMPDADTCPAQEPGGPTSSFRMTRNKRASLCPPGHKRCPVITGSRLGYECVDVQNDLWSCGGCVDHEGDNEDSGVDCSDIPHAAAVSCIRGKCVVSECASSHKLVANGTCVHNSHYINKRSGYPMVNLESF